MSRARAASHVLIVDDDMVNLELLQAVLEGEGFRVSSATTAQSAIETAHAKKPDLILMDVQLPGMDGLEATKRLKSDDLTVSIPVIAVTAHVRPDDQERCLEVGCVKHIAKPIDTRALPEIIREVLRSTAAARQ